MIHTKQPANQFYVYLTAFRSSEPLEVNQKMLKGMAISIRKFPGLYGVLEHCNIQGCYQEAGTDAPSIEQTLRVRCRDMVEVENLMYQACETYSQDAVLVVNSQTHTASLMSLEWSGDYPYRFPQVRSEVIGTFTQQDTGSAHYSIIDGVRWEVA